MQGTVANGGGIIPRAFGPGSLQQPQAEYVRLVIKTAHKKKKKMAVHCSPEGAV